MSLPSNIEPTEELIVVDGQRDLENSLANIGSISLEGTSFSIGNILLSMKELYRNRPNSITCSIQDYGPSTIITSIFHDSRDNGKTYTWEVKGGILEQNETSSEQIPLLIEDLAFQITHSLGKQNSKIPDAYPQNWQTYKELLKAREAFNIYKANGSINHLDSSEKWISRASEFEPNYKGALRRSILYDLGFAFLYEERYNDSIEIFRRLSALDPEIGYFGLALAYYGLDDYEKALSNINRVTVLSPDNAYAWLIKGIILTTMGKNEDAIEILNKSISLNSTIGWSYFFKGLNEFKLDNDKIALDESFKPENMKDALESFNKSIDKDPKNSWAIFSKGRILRDSDTDAALSLFNEAIKYDPYNEFAWNERGNCLSSKGQYREALEAKMIALELEPDRWNIQSDTEDILKKLGMTDEESQQLYWQLASMPLSRTSLWSEIISEYMWRLSASG